MTDLYFTNQCSPPTSPRPCRQFLGMPLNEFGGKSFVRGPQSVQLAPQLPWLAATNSQRAAGNVPVGTEDSVVAFHFSLVVAYFRQVAIHISQVSRYFPKVVRPFSKVSRHFPKVVRPFLKVSRHFPKVVHPFSKVSCHFSKVVRPFSKVSRHFPKVTGYFAEKCLAFASLSTVFTVATPVAAGRRN